MPLLHLVLILLVASVVSSSKVAVCHLKGTAEDSAITGLVRFSELGSERTLVEVQIQGVTKNTDAFHGLHIHEFGDLSDANYGTSTGGHFVGSGSNIHDCEGANRHAGDLGNWKVDAQGRIFGHKELDLLPLSGLGSIVGRGMVLHSAEDDCQTQPTGNAGGRLAFCVIGIANNSAAEPDLSLAPTRLVCSVRPLNPMKPVVGTVWFESVTDSSFRVVARVEGLAKTSVGIHIHQYGDMSHMNGDSAGGHFNPASAKHGLPPASDRHFGDLGNIHVHDDNGVSWYLETITPPSGFGLQHAVGRSIVIHSQLDDGCTQPAGMAGSRQAVCVIGIANSKFEAAEIPATVSIPPQRGVHCGPQLNPSSTVSWAIVIFIAMILFTVGFMYTRSSKSGSPQDCLPKEPQDNRHKLK